MFIVKPHINPRILGVEYSASSLVLFLIYFDSNMFYKSLFNTSDSDAV